MIFWQLCLSFENLPFKGNNYGEEDGVVEDDVVERIKNLREKDCINLTVEGERPLEL